MSTWGQCYQCCNGALLLSLTNCLPTKSLCVKKGGNGNGNIDPLMQTCAKNSRKMCSNEKALRCLKWISFFICLFAFIWKVGDAFVSYTAKEVGTSIDLIPNYEDEALLHITKISMWTTTSRSFEAWFVWIIMLSSCISYII